MMPGRRYSEGLHQALEAKEHVQIQPENQTLASITFQNYFRLYDKLAGMTGTARPKPRNSATSTISKSSRSRPTVPVIAHRRRRRGLPDGRRRNTRRSSARSRRASAKRPADAGRHHLDREVRTSGRAPEQGRLQAASISRTRRRCEPLYQAARERPAAPKHFAVLNARYHEQEAFIVAQAGVPGAITIATNMAGRGTDIQLGGNAEMRIERELAGVEGEERAPRARRRSATRSQPQGEGARRRRPLRARHRAPRIPPHRQPAARPLRPSGRPGPLEILPVAAGRPDAHLRLRPHGRHAAEARPQGRRGDRPSVDQQGASRGRRRRSRRATSTSARTS